jgi:hypothetical protein
MSYQSTGKVKALTPIETVGNGHSKRTIVISETNGQYTNDKAIELFGELADKTNVSPGQEATVTWFLKSNFYEPTGRWYSSASGLKVEVQGQAGSVQQQQPAPYSENELDSEEVPY